MNSKPVSKAHKLQLSKARSKKTPAKKMPVKVASRQKKKKIAMAKDDEYWGKVEAKKDGHVKVNSILKNMANYTAPQKKKKG